MTSTTPPESSPARALRSTLRLLIPLGVVGAVLAASPALADVPEGWSDPDPVSGLDFALVLLGLPLLCVLIITAAVYAPVLARGEKLSSHAAPVEDQWLGGPRGGRAELTGSAPATTSSSSSSETGGASGGW